jgi:hypothetical protein
VIAKIGGRRIEIPDERVRGGVDAGHTTGNGSRRDHATHKTSSQRGELAPSPLPGWPKPTDKWNYSYAQFLELEKQSGRIHWWAFEPFSMWLPGQVRYKPDFLIQYPDGLERKLEFVEVKGFSKNLRDGITRYKIASAMFPCFDWKMVKRERGGWQNY